MYLPKMQAAIGKNISGGVKTNPPQEIFIAELPDPDGGWGGPPYWQFCSKDTAGAVRYCPTPKAEGE